MTCENAPLIHALHDNQLSQPDRAQIQSHLAHCPQCSQLLMDLQNLSKLLASVPLTQIPSHAMGRALGAWNKPQQDGILRLAKWLTGIAAGLLVAALIPWNISPSEPQPTPQTWEQYAVSPHATPENADNDADLIQTAQWTADELSPRGQ